MLLVPVCFFFFSCISDPRALHSFPTRRSSDLRSHLSESPVVMLTAAVLSFTITVLLGAMLAIQILRRPAHAPSRLDRKSTRLNSSHPSISYAVFCLKKKTFSSLSTGLKFVRFI